MLFGTVVGLYRNVLLTMSFGLTVELFTVFGPKWVPKWIDLGLDFAVEAVPGW